LRGYELWKGNAMFEAFLPSALFKDDKLWKGNAMFEAFLPSALFTEDDK
jgi:hypothetical protein